MAGIQGWRRGPYAGTEVQEAWLQSTVHQTFARHLFVILVHLGGPGLLAFGVLDSSFLFMPLGNDLLVMALTVREHSLMPYFAAMAAAGSVIGCALTDVMVRGKGEKGLERYVPARRLAYIKKRIQEKAGWTLAVVSLIPPPFPFTAFVAAAAALQYPRRRLLAVIGASRLFRFLLEGLLALWMGREIIRIARSRTLEYVVLALVAVSIAGSVISVYGWVKRSRPAVNVRGS